MGTDITSWGLRIGIFMCSPRRLASGKFSVAYNFFTTSNPHMINGSRTFITLSRWLFLVIMFTSFVVLIVRLLQITDNSQLSSDPPAKLGRSVHSLTSPFDHRTMHKHLYTTPLLIIAKSMDIHPNPGPTAIHILNDLTSIEQRLLSTEQQSKTLTTKTSPLQMTWDRPNLLLQAQFTKDLRSLPRT